MSRTPDQARTHFRRAPRRALRRRGSGRLPGQGRARLRGGPDRGHPRRPRILLLIAGDLFDNNRVPDDDFDFVRDQLARLSCPVLVLPGNHDVHDHYSICAVSRRTTWRARPRDARHGRREHRVRGPWRDGVGQGDGRTRPGKRAAGGHPPTPGGRLEHRSGPRAGGAGTGGHRLVPDYARGDPGLGFSTIWRSGTCTSGRT